MTNERLGNMYVQNILRDALVSFKSRTAIFPVAFFFFFVSVRSLTSIWLSESLRLTHFGRPRNMRPLLSTTPPPPLRVPIRFVESTPLLG